MTTSTDRLHEYVTKEGGGPKTPKMCVMSFMGGPKHVFWEGVCTISY